jgi:thiol-disulfide isomerase/thioredoxin
MGESSDYSAEDILQIFVVVIVVLAFLKVGCDMMFPVKAKRKFKRRMNRRYEPFDAAISEQNAPVNNTKLPSSKPNPPGGGVTPPAKMDSKDEEFNKASQEKINRDVSKAQAAMKDESGVDPRTGKQFLNCPVPTKKILPPVNQQINALANRPSGAALQSMDRSAPKAQSSGMKAEVTLHWANWCPHSRNAASQWDPSLMDKPGQGLSSKLDGKTVAGVAVKTDSKHFDTPESKQEKIQAFPTYVVKVFKDTGEMVARYTYNAINSLDVENKLNNLLSNVRN